MATPPPCHPDADEAARCDIAARRVRMLDGMWTGDAAEALAGWFAVEVQDTLPDPETSRNPLLDMVTQLGSMIYQQPYHVQMLDETGAPVGDKVAVDLSTLGAQQELVRYMLGINECPLRLDVDDAGAVTCRVVTPDTVAGWPSRSDPTQFRKVEHSVEREIDGKTVWTWDRWDISDPANPVYQVIIYGDRKADGTVEESDVTQQAVGFTGWPKRYTDATGAAVMPWIQYHRYSTPRLWTPDRGSEAVRGTLTTACLWTAWEGGVRDTGFPTRAVIDGTIEGGSATRKNGVATEAHVLSPMSILQIRSRTDAARASLDGWTSTYDAKANGEAISDFQAGLATSMGLSAADVTRGGETGMSGYALVVSRDGLRRQWQRIQVPLAKCDAIRVARTVALARIDAPTSPGRWRILYPEVQDSAEERAARVDEAVKLYEAGIITATEAYMRTHPGIDEDEAEEAVAEAQAELAARTKLAAPSTAPPPTDNQPPSPENQAAGADAEGSTDG